MKGLLLVVLLSVGFGVSGQSFTKEQLIGQYMFHRLYNNNTGKESKRNTPYNRIDMVFNADGTSIGEGGTKGRYRLLEGNIIIMFRKEGGQVSGYDTVFKIVSITDTKLTMKKLSFTKVLDTTIEFIRYD